MQTKVELVRSWLSESFGGAPVSYQHAHMLHKFRIETAPHRWLYVSDEFIDDQPEGDLPLVVGDFEVFQQLLSSPGPAHLLLTQQGIAVVDANFGRSANE